MTADELARAAAKGDLDAFERLVRLYEKKVYALTLRMCGNPEDANDAAQEAFLSAWRGLPSFRGEAGFSTWLCRLAANASIDILRRKKRFSMDMGEPPMENLPDCAPGPQEIAESVELQNAVATAVQQLGESHRQIIEMREYREMSYDEIARALSVDLGTVKSRLSRARRALRKILLESGNLSGYLPSKETGRTEKTGNTGKSKEGRRS